MVIESTLSQGDYIKINLYMAFRKRLFYVTVAAVVLLTALAVVSGNSVLLLVWLWFGFVVAPVFYRTFRAALSSKNANFYLPCRRTFDDEGVRSETSLAKSVVPWSIFVNWHQAAGYYLLYASSGSFCAVSKAAIPPADVPAFEALLRAKIKKK